MVLEGDDHHQFMAKVRLVQDTEGVLHGTAEPDQGVVRAMGWKKQLSDLGLIGCSFLSSTCKMSRVSEVLHQEQAA